MRHLCSPSRRGVAAPTVATPGAMLVMLGPLVMLVTLVSPACVAPLRAQVTSAPAATSTQAPTAKPAPVKPALVKPAPAPAVAGTPTVGDGVYTVERPTVLRAAPEAAAVGELRGGATVEVVAHERGWVRVRTEAWIPAAGLLPADTAFRAHLSAADLRADPDGTRGKVVQWTVQFLALQTADPLRQGMADGEPYLLAKGPNGENALVYLVVPPSLLGTARALDPLVNIAVTARVRDGRSEPVGVPILDLQALRRLQ